MTEYGIQPPHVCGSVEVIVDEDDQNRGICAGCGALMRWTETSGSFREVARCRVEGCEGRIEASAPLWLNVDADGIWSVYGVGDETARITCDDGDHDNWTETLDKSLSAFIEEILPGTTWVGSEEK